MEKICYKLFCSVHLWAFKHVYVLLSTTVRRKKAEPAKRKYGFENLFYSQAAQASTPKWIPDESPLQIEHFGILISLWGGNDGLSMIFFYLIMDANFTMKKFHPLRIMLQSNEKIEIIWDENL